MTYAEKLKDPRWKAKRMVILERDNHTCQKCGNGTDDEMHIHHKRYLTGLEPWEYKDRYLETLCYNCHEEVHVLRKKQKGKEGAVAILDRLGLNAGVKA